MKIIETKLFKRKRDNIVYYIASDNKTAAIKFAKKLKIAVNNLVTFPYKYRKSYYYDNENIRDMIFKSYTIIYKINEQKNIIEILEIFNQNLPVTKEYNENN